VRTTTISDVKRFMLGYWEAWREGGHPGHGEVGVILPVYVAETDRRARDEAQASTVHFFRSIAEALAKGPRKDDAAKLGRMTLFMWHLAGNCTVCAWEWSRGMAKKHRLAAETLRRRDLTRDDAVSTYPRLRQLRGPLRGLLVAVPQPVRAAPRRYAQRSASRSRRRRSSSRARSTR
jgi:hypothetical protein